MPEASAPEYQFMQLPEINFSSGTELDSLSMESHDGILLVFHDAAALASQKVLGGAVVTAINDFISLDQSATKAKEVNIIPCASAPGGKVVLSPTGPLLRDQDDVRRYAEAAARAVRRAKSCGSIKNPLLVLQDPPFEQMEASLRAEFARFHEVAALAALAEMFEPLEARESLPELAGKGLKGIRLVAGDDAPLSKDSLQLVKAIETGRRLARDIGGPDPERMTSIRAAETVLKFLSTQIKGEGIKAHIIDDLEVLKKEYPLLAAVARASEHVPRHAPRVVHLEYRSPDQSQVEEELYMVGKGINYDTGGADVKYGGNMVGMSRDKCGAAALAGFFAACAILQPRCINLTVDLAFVRNSIGSNAYVTDEIIKSRAGARVRVGNTDAEGRMVMADLLAQMKERALEAGHCPRARLFTCATLTGHVVRTYGPYAAAMDNGPARLAGIGERLKTNGQRIGDCFELSTLRREDYDFVAGLSNCEDVLQANRQSSVATSRGHQYPAAFLQIASGLVKHGLDAPREQRLAYTHLDIAGAAEEGPGPWGRLTGSPIACLATTFLGKN